MARRAPTIATRVRNVERRGSPSTCSTAGGSGSARSRAGYASEQRHTSATRARAATARGTAASNRS